MEYRIKVFKSINRSLLLQIFCICVAVNFAYGNCLGQSVFEAARLRAATNLFNQGLTLLKEGSTESRHASISKFEDALRLYQGLDNREGIGGALYGLGMAHDELGNEQKALDYYNQALPLAKDLGYRDTEALLLSMIGLIYEGLEHFQKASEYCEESLLISKELKDTKSEELRNKGINRVRKLDKIAEGIKLLAHAGELFKKGSKAALEESIPVFNAALKLFKDAEFKDQEGVCLGFIGRVYYKLDRWQSSFEHLNKALVIFKANGNSMGEGAVLNDIGLVYTKLGEKEKAIDYLNQALNNRKNSGYKKGEAISLNNIANLYFEQNEKDTALEFLDRSLAIVREIKDKPTELTTLINIGLIYIELNKWEKATDYLGQALNFDSNYLDKEARANIVSNLGKAAEGSGDRSKAVEFYNQALFLFSSIGDKEAQAMALNNLMYAWALKNRRLAILYGKQAVRKLQELRLEIKNFNVGEQKSFLNRRKSSYQYLSELLIVEKRFPEASQILNSYRDQESFDFDNSATGKSIPITFTIRETDFVARSEKIYESGNAINGRIGKIKVINDTASTEENVGLQKLESDMNNLLDGLNLLAKLAETEFSKSPDEKDIVGVIPDLLDTQSTLLKVSADSKKKMVAVYQLVGAENYRAIIISADGIKSVSVPIKSDVLNTKVRQFWGLLQSDKYDVSLLSKELYDVVFKAIEKELPNDSKTILWSLGGNLRYVPMGALFDGKQYLAERYNHVNFTRADMERMTRPVSAAWTATGLGTSKQHTVSLLGDSIPFNALPGVTAEFEQLFKLSGKTGLLDGHVLRDAAFDQKSMLEQMKLKRPVVHIASHFSFRPGDEARSFLLLGDGTAFTLADMKKETNMFAGVELLTLSACNTAAQQADANGREIDGFAELAQRLGANSVMATLWPVADASTPGLMREFYSGKLDRKLSKAESLRQAQLALLRGVGENGPVVRPRNSSKSTEDVVVVTKDGKPPANAVRGAKLYLSESDGPLYDPKGKPPFAHPHYWAPFILFGNWQ